MDARMLSENEYIITDNMSPGDKGPPGLPGYLIHPWTGEEVHNYDYNKYMELFEDKNLITDNSKRVRCNTCKYYDTQELYCDKNHISFKDDPGNWFCSDYDR